MKWALKVAAYCCGGIIGVAAAAWEAEWCSGISFVMILIGCGCGLVVALHELAVISAFGEERERGRPAQRAGRPSFFGELDKL